RLRKASKSGTQIHSIASHTTRGLAKMNGTLIQTRPGDEAVAIAGLELDKTSVLLVGERLATVPGALSAAQDVATKSGAKLAWIPRRAGERGAVETGCLPTLLPGGRPVADPSARADLATAWGVPSINAEAGRDTSAILAAAESGALKALVIGGVEVDDLPDPIQALAALRNADFVVSLEVRESAVTDLADVVLPVSAVVEKSGMFVNWEGRLRSFGTVLDVPNSLTDIRVLAGIAEELGAPLGFRTSDQARADMIDVGPWDGKRGVAPAVKPKPVKAKKGQVILDTWCLMIDDGRSADGQPEYKSTARQPVLRASDATLAAAGAKSGDNVTLSTTAGKLTLTSESADLPDGVVWAPSNSGGLSLRRHLGAGYGDTVKLKAAGK
ncbi:MAG TPA: molybdopterin-dependent oxidoreductase, partial [Aeromicrobium sp.]|nr:molybdopterin-dependent oxidoreductase [Aeromicrobium sp.]